MNIEHIKSILQGSKTMTPDNNKYAICCVAILAAFAYFNEPLDNFMGSKVSEPQTAPVFIKFDTSKTFCDITDFHIFVDGNVCESSDLVGSFILHVASFFAFNISYPTTLKKSMTFNERIILKLTAPVRGMSTTDKNLEKRIIAFVSLLNSKN